MAEVATKTLYTPVFYAAPSSSTASTSQNRTKQVPEAYLNYLSRTHVALAQIVEEVPSSRCSSPVGDPQGSRKPSDTRINDLRRRVKDAIEYAERNPADGKWSAVGQLLRLSCTQGRGRWIRTSSEGALPSPSSRGWINAASDDEWSEWEAKWYEERKLGEKVGNWQQRVERETQSAPHQTPAVRGTLASVDLRAPPPKDSATRPPEADTSVPKVNLKVIPAALKASARDPRDPTPLGFSVKKRGSNVFSGKPKPSNNAPPNDAPPPSRKPDEEATTTRQKAFDSASEAVDGTNHTQKPNRVIADISETSFLPPSFPSQLGTSTPKAQPHARKRPSPIKAVDSPPDRLIPDLTSSSPIPSEPVTPANHERLNVGAKRQNDASPGRSLKKARTLPALPFPSSSAASFVDPLSRRLGKNAIFIPHVAPAYNGVHPTLPGFLAEAQTAKTVPSSVSSKADGPGPQTDADKVAEAIENEDIFDHGPPSTPKHHKPTDLFAKQPPRRDPTETELIPPAYSVASPAKSLSSLAASDSDEDEDPIAPAFGEDAFDPPLTSTQRPPELNVKRGKGKGLAPTKTSSSTLLSWPGYNSQFDVDSRVEEVNKLLERDVEFDQWLRDPSAEPGGN